MNALYTSLNMLGRSLSLVALLPLMPAFAALYAAKFLHQSNATA